MQANLRAATTDDTGEACNTGTGSSVSIRGLAETMRDAADTGSEIVHTDARDGDIKESVADISKAREQLGFEPQVSLDEGLERLLSEH
ncbi:GDP-mannose 4,6-dehydratase [Halarchaeum sp. CBA1220]|uniref:GDP-mannose 4,6-dehydratase n=1 Tax=Halarchaeum sp. CBA1220 TaxID=1853682 RepID=UPI0026A254CC